MMEAAVELSPAVMAPVSSGGVDPHRIRADFPALHQQVHGKPLVYLDNAATTQKPQQVIDAVVNHYRLNNANVHRGVHLLSLLATDAFEEARQTVARHLGAADAAEVVFVRGATEAINLVAHSFLRSRLQPGDEVLISSLEHHSNIVPWQLLCKERGAQLRVIPMNDRGELLVERYIGQLTGRTKLVALSHVANSIGTINPVQEMIELAHERGVPVLIDGAQAVPHLPVDVCLLDCDFYVFSGHKAFAPAGIGVLFGKRSLLEAMEPYQSGGDMISSVTFKHTEYAAVPHRFEAGTPNVEGAIGLAVALRYLEGIGLAAMQAHEQQLLHEANEALATVPGLRQIGTAAKKVGVLSFVLDGIHAHDVGTVLDQEGIAVRAGHHCAQPVIDRFGVPATVRASFACYNTSREVAALVAALHKVRDLFS